MHNEVFGAFVLSTVGKGTITKMDPSEALVSYFVDIAGSHTTQLHKQNNFAFFNVKEKQEMV